MARVFTRGFEDGEAAFADDYEKLDLGVTYVGTVTNQPTILSFGTTRCILVKGTTNSVTRSAGALYLAHIVPQTSSASLDEVYVRIYAKMSVWSGNKVYAGIGVYDENKARLVELRNNGDVITPNGTVSAGAISSFSSSWDRYEFYVKVATAGNGGGVIIRLNGSIIYSSIATGGEDMTSGGGLEAGYIACTVLTGYAPSASTSVIEFLMDDIAVNDTVGISDSSYPGEGRIVGLLPTAAGSNSDMTPLSGDNYANVDDAQSSGNDGDTTYVAAAVSQEVDSYVCENLATKYPTLPTNTAISRVTLMTVCRTPATGLDIRGVVVDGSTENGVVVTPEGVASYGLNGSVVTHPDGNWTYARVNSAEFGIESI